MTSPFNCLKEFLSRLRYFEVLLDLHVTNLPMNLVLSLMKALKSKDFSSLHCHCYCSNALFLNLSFSLKT